MVVEAEAISGRANSQAHMGFVCLDGLYGRRVDTDMAFMWFSKAAEKNNEYGLYGLAICYEEGKGVAKNEAKALEYYKKAGNLKCAGALIDLGNHFFAGTLGLEKSERDAVLCWKQAAQLGDKLGQYKYGACYLNGIGLIQNDQQAFEWFRKSAKQGFAAAQYKLGCCFLDGIGTQQDFKAAYQWLTKAEDQGHKEAKEVLSQYFDANGHYKP
jgi:hypothetical protein